MGAPAVVTEMGICLSRSLGRPFVVPSAYAFAVAAEQDAADNREEAEFPVGADDYDSYYSQYFP